MKNKFYVVYAMGFDGIVQQDTVYTQKKQAIKEAKNMSKSYYYGYCDHAYNPEDNIEYTVRSKKYKKGKEIEHYTYGID